MTAFGTKRTSSSRWRMSAFGDTGTVRGNIGGSNTGLCLRIFDQCVLGFPTSAGEGVAAQLTCDKYSPPSRKTSVQRSLDMTAWSSFLFTNSAAVSFLTIAATSSVVLAQRGPVAACAPDIQAQCAGHPNAEGRRACIKTRFKDFSLPCQLVLVKARAVGKACRADVKKNCAGIKPGGGRIETCMKDHFADMRDACKEVISQAGGGKS
jgi:hypothetical protein